MKIVKTKFFFTCKRKNPFENYFFLQLCSITLIAIQIEGTSYFFFALSQIKVFFSSLSAFVILLSFCSSIGLFLS